MKRYRSNSISIDICVGDYMHEIDTELLADELSTRDDYVGAASPIPIDIIIDSLDAALLDLRLGRPGDARRIIDDLKETATRARSRIDAAAQRAALTEHFTPPHSNPPVTSGSSNPEVTS